MTPSRPLTALLAVALLAGCETLPNRADGCLAEFNPRGAKTLKVSWSATWNLRIYEDAPCRRNADGSESSYQILALDEYKRPYYVQALSTTSRDRELFAPVVAVLDGNAKVTRWIPSEKWVYRGDRLTASLFFNAENAQERYLVVMSNPLKVGQTVKQRLQDQERTSLLIASWYGGDDRELDLKLTRYGEVQVRARQDPSVK